MKHVMIFGFAFALAGAAAAALPVVENVRMEQDAGSRQVTISYDLVGAPAIVTFDVETNGVSIGTIHLDYAVGDVHRTVQPGAGRRIYWQADKGWPGHVLAAAGASAKVTAWPLETPPPYMVLHLVNPNDVRHYATPWELPGGGVTNDLYKTDALVLRRIPAKDVEWTMGSPTNAPGVIADGYDGRSRETPHQVTLTNDFYIGVYELTQKQWLRVKGTYPTYATADKGAYLETDRDVHPADCVSWTDIRGMNAALGWPQNDEVDPAQFMGMLRAYSGMRFDLPTEAEWEYACKAGTMSALYPNHELFANGNQCALLEPVAVFIANARRRGGDVYASEPVGTKEPNAWGLYDMLGNVYEWCLDRAGGNDGAALAMAADAVVSPRGKATGDYRVKRGGCMAGAPIYTRSTYRGGNEWRDSTWSIGFRVALRIP